MNKLVVFNVIQLPCTLLLHTSLDVQSDAQYLLFTAATRFGHTV